MRAHHLRPAQGMIDEKLPVDYGKKSKKSDKGEKGSKSVDEGKKLEVKVKKNTNISSVLNLRKSTDMESSQGSIDTLNVPKNDAGSKRKPSSEKGEMYLKSLFEEGEKPAETRVDEAKVKDDNNLSEQKPFQKDKGQIGFVSNPLIYQHDATEETDDGRIQLICLMSLRNYCS